MIETRAEDLKNIYKLMILADDTFSYCLSDFLKSGEVCVLIFDFLLKLFYFDTINSMKPIPFQCI